MYKPNNPNPTNQSFTKNLKPNYQDPQSQIYSNIQYVWSFSPQLFYNVTATIPEARPATTKF